MTSDLDQHVMAMLIRKLESIATLTDEERQGIESLPARVQHLDARQDIVRQGDKPSHCCLILDGWACRYKLLSQGKRQILSLHIADLQSLHVPTLDHSLAAVTKATVAFIPHESLRNLIAGHPGIAAVFWRDTLINAAIFQEWMVGLGRRSALQRIAHLICETYLKLHVVGLADDHRFPLPLTQVDLADALGLTPVHVNRVLKEMRGRSLITLRNRMLVIAAWDELMRLSEFDPAYLHLERPAAA